MGMELSILAPSLDWTRIRSALDQFAPKGSLRMADGQLTFPEEEPSPDWRELRVALPSGMVTLKRTKNGLDLITWGNISEELLSQRNQLGLSLGEDSSPVLG